MDEKDISLFDTVFSELTIHKRRNIDNLKDTNKFLVEQFTDNKSNQIQNFKTIVTDFPPIFLEFQEYLEKQNELTSSDLNIFRMFGVGETKHSYLLANLLNPYAEHGQKHLFLNVFLDLLKIKRKNDSEKWIVTAEKGRIDVLLKRADPHSVIVIENKSNYASDQENQLYRYWHQEIYKTICNRLSNDHDHILDPPACDYQLIYLTPHGEGPNDDSLCKPSDWDDSLPNKVPLELKCLSFDDFIVQWLCKSLEKLPKENYRIREHIKQYLEFWT